MLHSEIELARQLVEKFGNELWKPGMRIGAPYRLGTMRPGMTEPWAWTRLGSNDDQHGMCIEQVSKTACPDLIDSATAYLLFEMASEYHFLELSGCVSNSNVVLNVVSNDDEIEDLLFFEGHLGVVSARILLGLPSD